MLDWGVFWFLDKGEDIDISLENSYLSYCCSVHSRKRMSESYGVWSPSEYSKVPLEPSYKKFMKKEDTKAEKEYEQLERDFSSRLIKIISRISRRGIDMGVRELAAVEFAKFHERAWNLGRKASGVFFGEPEDVKKTSVDLFRRMVGEQLAYWNKFLKDVDEERLKVFSVEDRVSMYVDSLKAMFNKGRVSGMPKMEVLLSWYPPKKKTGVVCPGCVYMVENSPFPADVMPTIPRGGDTPCLSWCVHKVVVKYVKSGEVEKRRSELPGKDKMLSDLKVYMRKKKSVRVKKDKYHNPWVKRRGRRIR